MIFSNDRAKERYSLLCLRMKFILEDLDKQFTLKFKKEITITETVTTLEEDQRLNRQSDTHRTRRAADIRTINLKPEEKEFIIDFLNEKYKSSGAMVNGVPNLVVDKPHGSGPHLHIQLSRKFELPTYRGVKSDKKKS